MRSYSAVVSETWVLPSMHPNFASTAARNATSGLALLPAPRVLDHVDLHWLSGLSTLSVTSYLGR